MQNFEFLEKGQGIVFLPHFVYDFSRQMFLMLCSVNWSNAIVWLHLLLEILDKTCIAIVYFPGYGVMYFEINLTYLSGKAVFLHD